MAPTNVFYFTDSAAFGGAEKALATLLLHVDRSRWRPTLLHHDVPGIAPLSRRAAELGVPTVPVTPMPLGLEGARRMPGFARTLSSSRPTVFHAHQTDPLACKYALAAAVLAGVPAVIATTHLFLEVGRLAKVQQRALSRRIDRWIAVSAATARRLAKMLGRSGRIVVVPNGVDADAFGRPCDPRLRALVGGPEDAPLVLAVGRLTEQKGFRYLIEAAARLPDVRIAITGDGPERMKLEAVAKAVAGDRVRFLGFRNDVPELLACCDVFVLPSLYEGLPLTILEAMAAGKPVIATSVDGNEEAVVHGLTGLLVPPADTMALARSIELVVSDSELARTFGTRGRARVLAHFSAREGAKRTMGIYEDALEGGDLGAGRSS